MQNETMNELLELSVKESEDVMGRSLTDLERRNMKKAICILFKFGGEAAIKAAISELKK